MTVVLASKGYPGNYEKGKVIEGLDHIKESEGIVFHAGTRREDSRFLTDGGRILDVTSFGDSVKEAISNTYRLVDKVNFENKYYRTDIGWRSQNRIGPY